MRTLLLALSCGILVTSGLVAECRASDQVWLGVTRVNVDNPNYTVRLGISDSAYIERPTSAVPRDFRVTDGPAAAALIAALTDGVNQPLTWSGPGFSYTFDENAFFQPATGSTYPTGFSSFMTRPTVDLQGWSIDYIRLGRGGANAANPQQFNVEVYAYAPEPGSFGLFVLGMVLMGHRTRLRK